MHHMHAWVGMALSEFGCVRACMHACIHCVRACVRVYVRVCVRACARACACVMCVLCECACAFARVRLCLIVRMRAQDEAHKAFMAEVDRRGGNVTEAHTWLRTQNRLRAVLTWAGVESTTTFVDKDVAIAVEDDLDAGREPNRTTFAKLVTLKVRGGTTETKPNGDVYGADVYIVIDVSRAAAIEWARSLQSGAFLQLSQRLLVPGYGPCKAVFGSEVHGCIQLIPRQRPLHRFGEDQ
jgi:hypothetical protein